MEDSHITVHGTLFPINYDYLRGYLVSKKSKSKKKGTKIKSDQLHVFNTKNLFK